jgi:hypothetical protein
MITVYSPKRQKHQKGEKDFRQQQRQPPFCTGAEVCAAMDIKGVVVELTKSMGCIRGVRPWKNHY